MVVRGTLEAQAKLQSLTGTFRSERDLLKHSIYANWGGMETHLCRLCNSEKPESDFYKSDKRRCKPCVRAKVKANRDAKSEYYKKYDAMRFQRDPWRAEQNRKRASTPEYKDKIKEYRKRWLEKNSDKRAAHILMGNAVRRGEIIKPSHCQDCQTECLGKKELHGHHEDYTKPLDVIWLCVSCHYKRHRKHES